MTHLAFGDELEHRRPRLLDRHGRIAVVNLQQIELFHADPPQAVLDVGANRFGT